MTDYDYERDESHMQEAELLAGLALVLLCVAGVIAVLSLA